MTLYQKPNKYLIITLFGLVLSLLPVREIHNIGFLLLFVFGFIWAILEITSGINAFRRLLGVVVLVLLLIALAI